MTTKEKTKDAKKKLEWKAVDPFEPRTYPPADMRFLFKRNGNAYAFFYGVHDGQGIVRSLLKKKGKALIECPLSKIEAFAVDGSTDIFSKRGVK